MPGESPDVPCMALIPVAPLFQHRGWGGDLLLGWFAAKTKPCHAQVPPALLREQCPTLAPACGWWDPPRLCHCLEECFKQIIYFH